MHSIRSSNYGQELRKQSKANNQVHGVMDNTMNDETRKHSREGPQKTGSNLSATIDGPILVRQTNVRGDRGELTIVKGNTSPFVFLPLYETATSSCMRHADRHRLARLTQVLLDPVFPPRWLVSIAPVAFHR